MALPLLFQAITTAGFVAGLLLLLRRAGPRWQGVAASLPVSSVPALFWLGLEQGAEFAASAAGAALLAAALTPLAAAVYGRLCARVGPLPCLLAALVVGAVALLLLMPWLGQRPLLALALALGMGALALHLLPHTAPAPARQRHWCSEVLLTAGVAGMLTLLVSTLALVVGPGACGALAALPVIGLSTVFGTHRAQGPAAARRFLAGLVEGNVAKAIFFALLAVGLHHLPLAQAWGAALLGGLLSLALLLQHRWLNLRANRGARAAKEAFQAVASSVCAGAVAAGAASSEQTAAPSTTTSVSRPSAADRSRASSAAASWARPLTCND